MKNTRLSENDRYKIEALRAAKVPVREIADILKKSVSCIYYELRKGKVMQRDSEYRDFMIYKADAGQRITDERKVKRGSHSKLYENARIPVKDEACSPRREFFFTYQLMEQLKDSGIFIKF